LQYWYNEEKVRNKYVEGNMLNVTVV